PLEVGMSYHEQLDALANRIDDLPDDQAVTQWLAMFDQWVEHAELYENDFSALMGVLPRPQAWAALSEAIDARPMPQDSRGQAREHLLRLFGHRLLNDREQIKADLEAANAAIE